ncbi:hypothetical protein KEM56_004419 [Ascosphaera pollenicola]|nr:hypothetical protein KEM56_004419 [Ascosphaera pollenicola]
MVLDLCNTWPAPITVQLDVLQDEDSDTAPLPPLSPVASKPVVFKIGDVLPPGHVSRFVFPVPRLYISDPTKNIPSLSLHSKRQFVVSAHKVSYDTEVSARETFWYRERLIGLLNCSWKEGDLTRDTSHPWRNELERGRKGIVDMRNLKLLPRMIDSLRVDDLEIGFDVEVFGPGSNVTSDINKSPNSTDASQQQQRSSTSPHTADSSPSSSPLPSISRLSASSFRVPRAEFFTLKVFLQNNSPNLPIHPLLRLQPSVRNQPHTHALDLQRRLAWTGMLQQGLPILGPKEKTVVEVGLTALCQGEFEIGASVEEIRILPPIQEQINEDDNEKKEETIGIEDMSIIGGALRSRRIWHSRVPCVLLAS